MPTKRIPLVGSPIFRNSDITNFVTRDQRFENCFPELYKNPVTGNGTLYLVKRTGFVKTVVAGSGYDATNGMTVWSAWVSGPTVMAAFVNGSNVTVYELGLNTIRGAAFAGPIASVCLSETAISSVPTLVINGQVTGSEWSAWYYQEGGSWTQITDVDYPGRPVSGGGLGYTVVGSAVHMDGYMFVLTHNPARIYNSDLNSLVNWTSTSFIEVQESPDRGVALEKLGQYIFAFSEGTVQTFVNSGNATGSPLSRVPGSTIRIGARYPGAVGSSVRRVGDAIYFIGQNIDDGRVGVYKITGPGQIKKISNQSIDKQMMDDIGDSVTIYIVGAMTIMGMEHIMFFRGIANLANAKIPMYCIDTNSWWYFNGADPYFYITACAGIDGKSYFMMANNAGTEGRNIYSTSHDNPVYQDDGVTFTMNVQTMPLDMGTMKLKEFTRFGLVADDQSVSATVTIAWSNNDTSTFTSGKSMSIATVDKSIAAGLGWGRRRSWKITDTANRPFRAEAFEVDWEVAEE